jgi:hypothetical protein
MTAAQQSGMMRNMIAADTTNVESFKPLLLLHWCATVTSVSSQVKRKINGLSYFVVLVYRPMLDRHETWVRATRLVDTRFICHANMAVS